VEHRISGITGEEVVLRRLDGLIWTANPGVLLLILMSACAMSNSSRLTLYCANWRLEIFSEESLSFFLRSESVSEEVDELSSDGDEDEDGESGLDFRFLELFFIEVGDAWPKIGLKDS